VSKGILKIQKLANKSGNKRIFDNSESLPNINSTAPCST